MPTVEDVWDDDSDLPLPSSSRTHLPHTGMKGALLEEITDDDLDFGKLGEQGRGEYGADSKAPPPSSNAKGKLAVRDETDTRPSGPQQPKIDPNTPMGGFMGDMMKLQAAEEARYAKIQTQFGNSQVAQDPSVYKGWNTAYPLYFDAKASISGGRRVPRSASLWWPQATHIARACSALRLPSVLEPEKSHPADWENPGRVKIQIEKDGRFLNPSITNRTQLCAELAKQMQAANPSLVPEPETKKIAEPTDVKVSKAAASKSKGKGKATKVAEPARHASKAPKAPVPAPPMDERLPLHSPMAPTGIALSSIKRDLETEKENKKKGIAGPDEGGPKQPKMKRMVVRGPRR